jgi:hypothetical protein
MAKQKEQQEARVLRSQGLSLNQIASRLKVAKASVSLWVRGIPVPERYVKPKPIRVPKMDSIDWDEVQSYYDSVRSLSKCVKYFGISEWMIGRAIAENKLIQHEYHRPLSVILTQNSRASTGNVRKRLFSSGVKQRKCEECGITEWNGKPVSFELHHKNGINNDHRLENLIILCPNCHSQTETYKGKNKAAARKRKVKPVA